ncbi:hypothetical protein BDU57DRAFT_234222 [Ampelomyces quisqualis]|uniref:Uncharacterized protein n=1 Tax=Ampelomyces quisqualis TaxID=50730 RepID=A0A6A5QP71_AMPQU|nr:hypothetical protein BDU57DRAFT_234222 [Ampelomyces quisqualis]
MCQMSILRTMMSHQYKHSLPSLPALDTSPRSVQILTRKSDKNTKQLLNEQNKHSHRHQPRRRPPCLAPIHLTLSPLCTTASFVAIGAPFLAFGARLTHYGSISLAARSAGHSS